jgi:uncharacterized protein YqeY/uncharacterized protein YndB with AHSA1/START domain
MSRVFTATMTVAASPDQVFELLTDPARHSEFDATGMVGHPASLARLTHVGQVFVMNMTYREGDEIEHYQSDNHVCALEPGRAIAWATATHGGAPLGWFWRYDVTPVAEGAAVTLTYDWTSTPPENIGRFGVPLADADGLGRSLKLLSEACGAAVPGIEAQARAALAGALRRRDTVAISALRSVLSAISNAEAVAVPPGRTAAASAHIAGAAAGLGAGEARRRSLSEAEVGEILQAEIRERLAAARDFEDRGHPDRAQRLRSEADVLTGAVKALPKDQRS